MIAIFFVFYKTADIGWLRRKRVFSFNFNQRSYAEAAVEFERSAAYRPDGPMTYYNIAQMYGAVGDKRKERRNYVTFIEKSALLKDTEENRELIEKVKDYLRM